MTGYIVTPEVSAAVTEAIRQAQVSRDMPVYWLIVGMPILTGDHAGKHFLPADDSILSAPLIGNPPLTPRDYPEFEQLIAMLGGLDARVELDVEHITQPPTDEL
jgi:hypothetical protein